MITALMLRKLLFGCSHQFSWPLKAADGSYYQVCVHCGVEYGYDWQRMQRTKMIFRDPAGHIGKPHSQPIV